MSRAAASLAAAIASLALLSGGVLAAKKKVATVASEIAAPEPGIQQERLGEVRLTTAVLPGGILDFAPARTSDGTPRMFALVRIAEEDPVEEQARTADAETSDDLRKLPACPQAQHLALYRVEATEPPRLDLVIDPVPDDVLQLDLADLEGDGTDEVLLRRPGEILVVRDGTLDSLLKDAGVMHRPFAARSDSWPDSGGAPHVVAVSVGQLEVFAPGTDGVWARRAAADLPIETAIVEGQGLRVSSTAQFVGRGAGGRLLYTSALQAFGPQRLRVHSIAVSRTGETVNVESWLKLPEPEQLLEAHALVAGERPLVLLMTKVAGKLDLFGEKRLRLFTLEPDRSRLGRPPVWQAASRVNLWQETHAKLLDADRDGRPDLVIAYWKGLTGDRVVLDVYRGLDEGWFSDAAITTAFDVKDADRSLLLYGADPTGDGRADLVFGAGGRLVIHAGLDSEDGADLVSRKPLPLPEIALGTGGVAYVGVNSSRGVQAWTDSSAGGLRVADLDGDGADELVQHVRGRLDEVRIIDLVADTGR